MSQNDMVIANQTAANFRTDLNNALQALASSSSGASAPSTTYANQLWYDTSANILKMRNEANSAWINVLYLDQTSSAMEILDDTQVVNTSGTQTGLLGDQETATWETGTGTTESLVSPAKVKASVDANTSVVLLQTEDVSGSPSEIVLDQLDNTTYDSYKIHVSGWKPNTDTVRGRMQFSSDGGSTWISGGSSYKWTQMAVNAGEFGSFVDTTSYMQLMDNQRSLGNQANEEQTFTMHVHGCRSGVRAAMEMQGSYVGNGGVIYGTSGSAGTYSTADIDAFRFYFSSGTMGTGRFKLYGFK